MASPIFRDMFSMPSKPSDASKQETEVPIIPVEEDAETLGAMLQILYPIDPPTIESLMLAGKLVQAFDKYFISMTKLQYHLRSTLNLESSLETAPLRCFSISWKLGLEPEAVRASRYTHSSNLSKMAVAEAIISNSGDLAALVALWDLRYRREESLGNFTDLVQPSTNIVCRIHGQLSVKFSSDRVRRARLKEVLNVPYPTCEDPEHFLGF
ncbi:hypothetical protein FRC04_008162 [Tulasnella sp. 424]|nr:hypothetical protein FRC04_008162 [Tulasnella sp. 424]KAG8974445.1 hypothetical protein FRC05_007244 [Tulasnella sp. 425]